MKKISLVLISLFVVLGFAGSALAVGNTGIYLGTLTANDTNQITTLENFLTTLSSPDDWKSYRDNYFSDGVDLELVGKSDQDGDPFTATITKSIMEEGEEIKAIAGTWDTNPKTAIYFYTIKAGNKFEIYWIEKGATYGKWDLEDEQNGMSHISGWTFKNPPTTPVPIPASVVLLAPALFGVVALSRRRKSYGRTNH